MKSVGEKGFALVETLVAVSIVALCVSALTNMIFDSVHRQRDEEIRLRILFELETTSKALEILGFNRRDELQSSSGIIKTSVSRMNTNNQFGDLVPVTISGAFEKTVLSISVLVSENGE